MLLEGYDIPLMHAMKQKHNAGQQWLHAHIAWPAHMAFAMQVSHSAAYQLSKVGR